MDSGVICRRLARYGLYGASVLGASVLLVLAGPGAGTAEAAGLCPGHNVRTLHFSGGEVRVYKNSGYVCAVTFAKGYGARRTMSVSVQARGSLPVRDAGRFIHHAGPVSVHAGHRCVRVSGSVGKASVSSGWLLC